ncbi:MAG: hypothetical protein LCH84_16410 [Gemmatimonadetes bacterium]|nr:hypothetical protein [Gemmatimonadota bacterium]
MIRTAFLPSAAGLVLAVASLGAQSAPPAKPAAAPAVSAPAASAPAASAPATTVQSAAGTVSAPRPDAAPAAPTVKTVGRKSTMPTEITLEREVFAYAGAGRRDPYKSLMSSSDVRPLLSDLRLTAVAFDPDGNNSVAILRDANSQQQYRVRVGQQLGRLRVSAIRQKAVQFTIEEFGFNRTETLPISSDTTKVRNP